ncbi:MAG: peptidoglycan editing factor PgeF [Aggregatilineales bacterium]
MGLERVQHQELIYYHHPKWQNIKHGIFTRHGGVSAAPWSSLNLGGTQGDEVTHVQQNHHLMYDALDVNGGNAVTTWMVHGVDVVIADAPVPGRKWLAQADAILTDKPDLPLVMRYADCTPLLYRDPTQGVIGLAHAGWRGTVQGMASVTVKAIQAHYGSNPTDIEVIIGPTISCKNFQVGEEVVEAFEGYFGTLDNLMRRDPDDGTAYLDLWEANRLDLVQSGIPDKNITIAGICTHARTDDFFSHRAEKGRTGRFGVVMSL